MPIRMSGLSSGLDTEAIVGALMSAQSLKKTKVVREKTKLEWKQTKWQDLNKKLIKLYNEHVMKLQMSSNYMTKKASVSDPTKASVKATSGAANGSYTLEIENIATSQYVTGSKISAEKGTDKLTDIDSNLLNKEITVTNGDKTTKFAVTADMTINDFAAKLREAGLNAQFDATQKRFFISSKESGLDNSFSITTSALSGSEVSGRQAVYNAVGYDKMTTANRKIVDDAMTSLQTSGVGTDKYNKALDDLAKAAYDTKAAAANSGAATYVKAKLYSEHYSEYETKAKDSLKAKYYKDDGTVQDSLVTKYGNDFDIMTDDDKAEAGVAGMSKDDYIKWAAEKDYNKEVAAKADADTASYVNTQVSTSSDAKNQIEEAARVGKSVADIEALGDAAVKKYYTVDGNTTPTVEAFAGTSGYTQASVKNDISAAVNSYASITDRNDTLSGSALSSLGLADIAVDANGDMTVNGAAFDKNNLPAGMAIVEASDSKIILNGAELTSSSATVSANGLEISLTGLTKGEEITFSVSSDVDAVYDSIKTFLTEYNNIMKEMNELYDAESAKGYEPLTSEQKESMTDEDVKLWEDKIKNSLLRRDSTLGGIIDGMRAAMTSVVSYDGKNYALSSFGIMTSTDYMEGGLFHIYGDKDDSVFADKDDKLRKALEEDPEAVTSVLSDIFSNLRQVMSNKMAGSKTSSALTFYNDITMKNDLKSYEKDIKAWEDKLADMEDAYYKKFTRMETALAKLQSQQSSLSSLFGG